MTTWCCLLSQMYAGKLPLDATTRGFLRNEAALQLHEGGRHARVTRGLEGLPR